MLDERDDKGFTKIESHNIDFLPIIFLVRWHTKVFRVTWNGKNSWSSIKSLGKGVKIDIDDSIVTKDNDRDCRLVGEMLILLRIFHKILYYVEAYVKKVLAIILRLLDNRLCVLFFRMTNHLPFKKLYRHVMLMSGWL